MNNFLVISFTKFRKVYLDNKDLLPLIILLPTMLGGVLQTVQLLFIGPEYIRFFSITQLVSDGILILSILSIIYLGYLFLKKFYNFKVLLRKLTEPNTNFKFAVSQFGLILFIHISLLVLFYILKVSKQLDNIEYSIGSVLIYGFILFLILPFIIQFIILILYFMLRFILYLLVKWKGLDRLVSYFNNSEKVKRDLDPYINVLAYILVIPVMSLIIGGIVLIVNFSISTNNPHKLANLECVNTLVSERYGEDQESKILYFNDKYFFIKITKTISEKNDEKVVIFKTENVLFKDNCR